MSYRLTYRDKVTNEKIIFSLAWVVFSYWEKWMVARRMGIWVTERKIGQ